MPRNDFAWVEFAHLFTATAPSRTETFNVEGVPVTAGDNTEGYVLVLARDVQLNSHRIQINGTDLPQVDIQPDGAGEWQTWMDRIPNDFLVPGANRITIRRVGNDDFTISSVVVHWREQG